MRDRKAIREHVDLVAIGGPLLSGGRATVASIGADRDPYLLEFAAVTDDARPARLADTKVMVDGTWLRQLVTAAREAGWTG